jgi:Asp-tRNA(Asn)/Glu-tRNA(Gln) amidotransferase A subunit family amidase
MPPRRDAHEVKIGAETMEVLMALIRYTATFNQSGHPVLAFPWQVDQSKIPGSLQLIGTRNSDWQLLNFARKYTSMEGARND